MRSEKYTIFWDGERDCFHCLIYREKFAVELLVRYTENKKNEHAKTNLSDWVERYEGYRANDGRKESRSWKVGKDI